MDERKERSIVLLCALVLVVAASIPYLWGLFLAPGGYSFLGFTHNIDDGAVYLSWVNQVARGKLFVTNLYTPEAHAPQLNLLFVLMGCLANITWLPSDVVFHLFRVGLAFAVVLCAWKLGHQMLKDARQRILFVLLLCFSSGLGWLLPGGQVPNAPVDTWQPEAITFLSVYLNPLFLAGLLLMLITFSNLLAAVRSGQARYAVYAGIALLILGNVHTYDVATVGFVWLAYLVVLTVSQHRFPTREIGLSALAALIAIPSLAYQVYAFTSDPAFQDRVNSPAPSPQIWMYFIGYGLVLLAATTGVVHWTRNRSDADIQHKPIILSLSKDAQVALLFVVVWGVVGFALPYLPVAQQRKLVMGLHIPLCILAAYGLAPLLAGLKDKAFAAACCGIVLLTAVSNWSFLANDSKLLESGRTVTHYPPFARSAEFDAMAQLKRVAGSESVVVYATPELALWIPVYTGQRVYYGHWSETPDYAGKLGRFLEFAADSTRDSTRDDILKESQADYLVYDSNGYPMSESLKSYLRHRLTQVWESGGVYIFRVNSQQSTVGGPRQVDR